MPITIACLTELINPNASKNPCMLFCGCALDDDGVLYIENTQC